MITYKPTIDNSIRSSLESYGLEEWIHSGCIDEIRLTEIDGVYYVLYTNFRSSVMWILLESSEKCTPTFLSEFGRIYSLPTHKYSNNVKQFRRYPKWLESRNDLIKGFTEYKGNYFMVTDTRFNYCYYQYGFCTACGILRCSPVWCICGHKESFRGWTSENERLDEFIEKSQLQTSSPNDAYLEWIPYDCYDSDKRCLHGLPTGADVIVRLIPLDIEITDETHDSYYAELCDEHPDILDKDVWITIGFTYETHFNLFRQGYYLVKENYGRKLCLACTRLLNYKHKINLFCFECKVPISPDWTTGNKSLDSLIMESWSNTNSKGDSYLQWIKYSLLNNVQEMTTSRHGCKLIADWLELTENKWTKVSLKKIVDRQNGQSFDFHQLVKEYPKILTPENMLIIGITQEPSTREYYLVFYHEIRPVLDQIIKCYKHVKYMEYADFDEIKEIGSGSYRTVYSAKYKEHLREYILALKRFKNLNQTLELFISEIQNHAKCNSYDYFLLIYGVTQEPETEDYMIVMQYANNGSLLSYLDQNINKLTWMDKLEHLMDITFHLKHIHHEGLVHCNLHGGNIVLHNDTSFISDLGHSHSMLWNSHVSTIQSALSFVAPEVFHTRKFTQKSDIYSLGIIMYLIATGELPFRDRQLNGDLVCDIMSGLRPLMPDSAPEEYKKLAEWCCDADPDKRPHAWELFNNICKLVSEVEDENSINNNNAWNAIYHSKALITYNSQKGE